MSCTQPFGQFERKFHFRSRTRHDRLTHFFECLCPLVLQLTRCLGDSFLCLRDLLLRRLRSFVQLGLITRHCVAPHFARNPGPALVALVSAVALGLGSAAMAAHGGGGGGGGGGVGGGAGSSFGGGASCGGAGVAAIARGGA